MSFHNSKSQLKSHLYNSLFRSLGLSVGFTLVCLTGCGSHASKSSSTEAESSEATAKTIQHVDSTVLTISIKKPIPMSKYLEKVKTISFDEDVESIMGIPQAIEICGDTIFAVESYQAPGVYAYLMDGTQLWAYCSEGGAEEDVNAPFNLSVYNDRISVFDRGAWKILTLDKQGKFISKTDLHQDALGAIVDSEGGIWTDYSNQRFADTKLSYRASAEDEEREILKVPELIQGMTVVNIRSLIPIYDGTINYLPALEPKVYSLHDGTASLKYILDFGSLWPDDDTFKKKFTGDSWAPNMRNFPIDRIKIIENSDWVSVSFFSKGDGYFYLYNKRNQKGKTYHDDTQEYYTPSALVGDTIYIQSKDNSLVAFKCK